MQYYTIARAILPKPLRRALVRRYRAQPEGLREGFWNFWNEIKIARVVKASNRSFESLKGKHGLRVHLGCGPHLKPGWVNIDLAKDPPEIDATAPPGTMFINYDLRLGLPLDNGSCDMIYSAHFIEHLEYRHGVQLLRECYRVLRSGGVFRACLPNFKGAFAAYLRGDHEYGDLINVLEVSPEVEPGTETLVDFVNYGVYQHGEHKCIYDEEKILLLLRYIGYSSVSESSFREDIDPNTELRRRYSFYVEAIK
jgi:predicted SAM-dependent methyltransferase